MTCPGSHRDSMAEPLDTLDSQCGDLSRMPLHRGGYVIPLHLQFFPSEASFTPCWGSSPCWSPSHQSCGAPIPLRVPSGAPRGASLSKPSHSDHLWPNPQLSGRKSGSSSKSLPEFERRSLGEGSNAIFKEILMVGISSIISKTERGHSGTGRLGRSPQRSASSLGASQRSHSSPLLLAQGSRSVPCSQPAELGYNLLRLPSVGGH